MGARISTHISQLTQQFIVMIKKAALTILLCLNAPWLLADGPESQVAANVPKAEAEPANKVITTPSGLKYRVLQIGAGREAPELEDRVTVHYSGKLIDGTEFDNTRKRGRPASFAISRVIEGWAEGLQLMTEGSKYQFIVPPELAYGDKGVSGLVGPQATLVFDVELLKVESEQ